MPSTFCTTQFPRFTGLVRSPGEFWVMKTDRGGSLRARIGGIVDADLSGSGRPRRFPQLRGSVVLGQDGIDEGVIARREGRRRAGCFGWCLRRKRMGSWNMASRRSLLNWGKRARSTALVGFKETEREPVAVNSVARPADAGVFHHAAGLGEEDCGFLQVVGGGMA